MNKDYQLGNLCSVGSSKRIHLSDYVEKGVPFYRSKEIIELSKGNNISDTLYISNEKYNEIKKKFPVPQENDILITSVGTIGISYLVKDANFYFKDGNLTWLRNINSNIIDVKFLIKWLKSDFFLTQIYNNNIGAVQKAITIDYLRQVKISLPDLLTQQKIASVLSALDDKIELNNSINIELEQMAKTLYDYWFVQFDFPNEDGKPYKSSGGKMVCNEVLKREIPEGWEIKNIEDICEIVDCLHSKKPNHVFENDKYYLLQLNNLLDNGLIDISKKYYVSKKDFEFWTSRITIKEHDILFTNAGRVAQTTQVSREIIAGIGRNITAVRPKNICPTFCYLSINGIDIQKQILNNIDQGAFFQSFNVKGIKLLNFIYPPIDMQRKFEKIVYQIRRKRELNLQQNQELASLRDWLLPMLMNGQVKVED